MSKSHWPKHAGKRRPVSSVKKGALEAERKRLLAATENPAPVIVKFVCPICSERHALADHEHAEPARHDARQALHRERRPAAQRSDYSEYMTSSLWAKTKRRYRTSKLPQRCMVCGDPQVHLHHRSYERLGNERLSDLVPLCQKHHEGVHDFAKANSNWSLWKATNEYLKRNSRQRQKASQ